MSAVEVEVAQFEADALHHAATTLRWLVGKSSRGWSHPAVDAHRCSADAERLEELYYAARERLRRAEVATVTMRRGDARLLRCFIKTATAAEGDEFGMTMTHLARLAHRITAHGRHFEPPRRERPSALA